MHLLIEATKRALRVRDRAVTDPTHLSHPLERYLDERFISGEAMKIDRRKAAPWRSRSGEATRYGWARPTPAGSSCPTSSRSIGNSAQACVLPRTGVLMQNRGASFSLEAGALNLLEPGPIAVPYAQSGARGAQ